MRADAVGPGLHLHLEHTQLDPDLEDLAAVARRDLAGDHVARLGVAGPAVHGLVDVPTHLRTPQWHRADSER